MPETVYDLYKPLRNFLRQCPLQESLYVVHAYSQAILAGQALPDDITAPPEYRDFTRWPEKGIYPWNLELLAKELFLHAPDVLSTACSLRRWRYFADAQNRLRDLEGAVYQLYQDRLKGHVLLELFRMSHRQFPWQRGFHSARFTRYYKIAAHPPLAAVIERVLGLTPQQLFLIGLAFAGFFRTRVAMTYPPRISIPELTPDLVDRFTAFFSRPLKDLRAAMECAQQYNENFFYTYNPLRAYPIIRMTYSGRDSLVCPVPLWSSNASRMACTTRSAASGIFQIPTAHLFRDTWEMYWLKRPRGHRCRCCQRQSTGTAATARTQWTGSLLTPMRSCSSSARVNACPSKRALTL